MKLVNFDWEHAKQGTGNLSPSARLQKKKVPLVEVECCITLQCEAVSVGPLIFGKS